MRKIQARPFMLFCLPLYPLIGALVLSQGWSRRWYGGRWLWWAIGQGLGLLTLAACLLLVRSNRAFDALPSLQLFLLAYALGFVISAVVTLCVVIQRGDMPGPFEGRMTVFDYL